VVVVCNCVAIVVLCRLTSPFLIAPEIAAVTATTLTLSPRFESMRSVALMAIALTLAVIVPWIAEASRA